MIVKSILRLAIVRFAAVLALSVTSVTASAHSSVQRCEDLLHALKFEPIGQDFIKVNGVAITGDFIYGLDMVIHDLELDAKTLREFKGRNVLSVGEGVSGLLPFLLKEGLHARGLDLWYGAGEFANNFAGRLMRDYVAKYGAYLIQGDGRKMPVADHSVDLVVSHLVVNNVSLELQKDLIRDAIRVAKRGGQVRIFGFVDEDMEQITPFLKAEFGSQITFSTAAKSFKFKFRGNATDHQGLLLTIDKLSAG